MLFQSAREDPLEMPSAEEIVETRNNRLVRRILVDIDDSVLRRFGLGVTMLFPMLLVKRTDVTEADMDGEEMIKGQREEKKERKNKKGRSQLDGPQGNRGSIEEEESQRTTGYMAKKDLQL